MPNEMQGTSPMSVPQAQTSLPRRNSVMKWVLIVLAIALVLAAVWYTFGRSISGQVLGTSTSYQAVFLTNGQVYFGKLSQNGDWMQLKDIYYLQVTQQLQPAGDDAATTAPDSAATQPNIQLVKLGSELHGPEDEMNIEKDKILFWENMKDDSKVVQAIRKYQESK